MTSRMKRLLLLVPLLAFGCARPASPDAAADLARLDRVMAAWGEEAKAMGPKDPTFRRRLARHDAALASLSDARPAPGAVSAWNAAKALVEAHEASVREIVGALERGDGPTAVRIERENAAKIEALGEAARRARTQAAP